jgi:pyridoxamine 5'-phosphate oxidase
MMKIDHLRKEYSYGSLMEEDLHPNPFIQFEHWLQTAIMEKVIEPTAMALSTVSKEGIPSSRMVLMKEWSDKGALFFSNRKSQKALEMEANPKVSCLFWWKELDRQVIFTGSMKKVPNQITLNYFSKRPLKSQIATWVSMQGQPLESKEILEEAFEELYKKYEGTKIPLPPHWRGYRIVPEVFQFWQGRPNRLHDRFIYKKVKSRWVIERLYP